MIPIHYGNKLEMSIDPGNSQNILVTYGNNSIWLDEVNLEEISLNEVISVNMQLREWHTDAF